MKTIFAKVGMTILFAAGFILSLAGASGYLCGIGYLWMKDPTDDLVLLPTTNEDGDV